MLTLNHPSEEIPSESLRAALLFACALGWRPAGKPMSDEERARPTIPVPAVEGRR